MDGSLHNSVFPHNDFPLRVHIAFETPIDSHGAVDFDFTFQFDTFCQQRNIAIVCIPGLFHGGSSVQANLPPGYLRTGDTPNSLWNPALLCSPPTCFIAVNRTSASAVPRIRLRELRNRSSVQSP